MTQLHPKINTPDSNRLVLALDANLAAKVFTVDSCSDIGSEAEKLKFANQINDLLPAFNRMDFDEEIKSERLVMEKFNPLDIWGWDVEKREIVLSVFENQLTELHWNGFVYRGLCRPSNTNGANFDNIILTEKGIRLMHVEISTTKGKVGDVLFARFVTQELAELEKF
jgi:hypothetical protein